MKRLTVTVTLCITILSLLGLLSATVAFSEQISLKQARAIACEVGQRMHPPEGERMKFSLSDDCENHLSFYDESSADYFFSVQEAVEDCSIQIVVKKYSGQATATWSCF
jgi:predicted AAA+ superfamily ATPase